MTPDIPPTPTPTPTPGRRATPSDHELLEQPARQSPLALVFIGWKSVRRLGVSGLVAAAVFIVNGGLAAGMLTFLVVATAVILVISTLSWYRFTFAVVDDELVVTRGITAVERLVIPLDRVQGVGVDERPAHRLLGLVSVSVDTAGSSGVEFEIDAIDRPRAEALRRLAADARRADARTAEDPRAVWAPPVAPDRLLLQRSARDLALIGVTKVPWAGLIALAPLIALFDEINEFVDVERRLDGIADQTEGLVGGSAVAAVLAGVIVVLAFTVIGALLQTVREMLTNWNLRLFRTPTGLRRTAGLLTTTSRSSTIRRIQTLTTDDSPPQRWLGITHARLRAYGDNDISLPGSSDDDVDMLRQLVFAACDQPVRDRMISRWYVFRSTRNGAVSAAVLTCALWFVIGPWSLLALLIVPCWWLSARRRWRLRRWGLTTERMAESYEFVARHTAELPLFKAQVVSVTQSLFERRKGLASVEVRTADGYLRVPMIDEEDAAAVRDRVVDVVVNDRRRFL